MWKSQWERGTVCMHEMRQHLAASTFCAMILSAGGVFGSANSIVWLYQSDRQIEGMLCWHGTPWRQESVSLWRVQAIGWCSDGTYIESTWSKISHDSISQRFWLYGICTYIYPYWRSYHFDIHLIICCLSQHSFSILMQQNFLEVTATFMWGFS